MRGLVAMLLSVLLLGGLVGCGSDHPFDNLGEPPTIGAALEQGRISLNQADP
jgi:hypothetical protein